MSFCYFCNMLSSSCIVIHLISNLIFWFFVLFFLSLDPPWICLYLRNIFLVPVFNSTLDVTRALFAALAVSPPRRLQQQGGRSRLVHNCTIFLCSLDVRNIVQGGDPLYAGFFSTQGSGGYTWPKWVRFFAKKHLPIVWRPEISFFGTPKFHILGTGGSFFRPFHLFKIYWVFAKFTELIRNLLVDPPIYL